MRNKIILLCNVFLACQFCTGCNSQPLPLVKKTSYGIFRYSDHDRAVIEDLIHMCSVHLNNISNDLELQVDKKIIIEIYPDQTTYDRNILNPELKGSPAISGNGIIQMVSPLSKIKIDTISYPNRLLFLIHEYVHIMLDQLQSPPPVFLDEGLACFYGSYEFYNTIVKEHFGELKNMPTIAQLHDHYYEIQAADVFSFLIVDYLMKAYKREPISNIIRNHDNSLAENSAWIQYVTNKYGNKLREEVRGDD